MFTLKLYRYQNSQLITKILEVADLISKEIGSKNALLEIHAYKDKTNSAGYDVFYIGEREPGMDAIEESGYWAGSIWGWGLLENLAGKTTQHFRPSSYGS